MVASEQEIGDGESKFAKALANNDVKVRDRAVLALSKWLASREAVSELDLLKLWKGMFFAMWHADKAPVQVTARDALSGVARAWAADTGSPWPDTDSVSRFTRRPTSLSGWLRLSPI